MDTASTDRTHDRSATRAMRMSVAAAVFLLAVKLVAYAWTDSSAILGDTAESVVHLAAILFAAYSLTYSRRPADRDHLYGHTKITFFSAGFEGAMIVIAAVYIVVNAIGKWLSGAAPTHLAVGLWLTVLVLAINGSLGIHLLRVGRRESNLILRANGQHVLTDAWTSLGVLIAFILILATGWAFWDPLFAIIVALNILWAGLRLMRRSFMGLTDWADPKTGRLLREVLDRECPKLEVRYHGLRYRDLGNTADIDVDLLFPDEMPLVKAHELATQIEAAIQKAVPGHALITTHLEPVRHHAVIHPDKEE